MHASGKLPQLLPCYDRAVLPDPHYSAHDVSFPRYGSKTTSLMLYSSAYVMGRDAFNSNKQTAKLGKYAFGFEWAAFACFLLATIFFCLGGRGRKDSTKSHSTSSSRSPIFGGKRSKSTRSQGSFFNSDADRKEYA